jgi:carbon storage regulator
MLVLSRKEGQSILIDGTTIVRVLEIRGNKVRLGIEAPEHVDIARTELFDWLATGSGIEVDRDRSVVEPIGSEG